jgi:protein SCO1/2
MSVKLGSSIVMIVAMLAVLSGAARAQGARVIESEVDPAIFRIDEARFLGSRPDPGLTFLDEKGQPFTFGEMTGKPLILVLSYYTCDGACSLVNTDLAEQLKGVTRMVPGRDFRILTVSFDPNDTAATLAKFHAGLDVPAPTLAAWRFSLPAGNDEARRLADAIGFKYFWSPRDRVFLHPGVFAFVSAEGRVVRYLYAMNSRPFDVELALMDARGDQIRPSEVVDYALSLCYSYNYKEGIYTLNITFIVGFGSLVFGFLALFASILTYKWRARKREIMV